MTVLPETQRALDDIRAERARQVDEEGYAPARDDALGAAGLARAAGGYAIHAGMTIAKAGGFTRTPPPSWPWSWSRWRPSVGIRAALVRAGALIVAAIEVLDRAASAGGETNGVRSGEGDDA